MPAKAAKPQPRLARLAAAIGEPARAAMLSRLLDGRLYTAGELAAHAGVAASTTSEHLALLLDQRLVAVRTQGRHRYYRLADGDVAHALEALLRVADGLAPPDRRWERAAMAPLRHARSCYGHLAGELGVMLFEAMQAHGWLVPLEPLASGFALSERGRAALAAWGVPEAPAAPSRPPLYGCVDWSQRREHAAGPQAVRLLETFIDRGWLRRVADTRELQLTPAGRQQLAALGLDRPGALSA